MNTYKSIKTMPYIKLHYLEFKKTLSQNKVIDSKQDPTLRLSKNPNFLLLFSESLDPLECWCETVCRYLTRLKVCDGGILDRLVTVTRRWEEHSRFFSVSPFSFRDLPRHKNILCY